MPLPEYIEQLQQAIRETHHCESIHRASVRVTDFFRGELAWDGEVEVFELIDHPKAKRCYAWGYEEDGKMHSTAVLHFPPVDSPQNAVKVAIAAKARAPQ